MVATPPDRGAVAPAETAASAPLMPTDNLFHRYLRRQPVAVAEPSPAALPLPPPALRQG